MSLYRKYRPQNFANLVGQEHVRVTLMNALKTQNVNHAYLFTGPRGTGKTSTARLLAKAINCENLQNGYEPCEQCDICRDIGEGRLIDLLEIDAASNRGIDEIRDLREKLQFSPTRAKSKVYIIDEVHMLTKEAFNALLKTLEEPPAHVYFILATTEVHKIPETILSRCQRFDFKRIEDGVLQQRLQWIAEREGIRAEESALQAIVHQAQGGLRDAIGLLEQLSSNGQLSAQRVQEVLGISGKMSIEQLFQALQQKNTHAALEIIQKLYGEGYDLTQFNRDFLEFLRLRLLASVQAKNHLETSELLRMLGFFQQAYEQARFSTIPQLPLEMAIVRTLLETDIQPITPPPSPRPTAKATSAPAEPPSTTIPLPKVTEERVHQSLQSASDPAGLHLDQIKASWSKVLAALQNPASRKIFPAATPIALEGVSLILGFQSNFFIEKIKETANHLDFETALFSVFQTALKVVPKLQGVTLQAEIKAGPDENAAKVLEIFGGEMVEGMEGMEG